MTEQTTKAKILYNELISPVVCSTQMSIVDFSFFLTMNIPLSTCAQVSFTHVCSVFSVNTVNIGWAYSVGPGELKIQDL